MDDEFGIEDAYEQVKMGNWDAVFVSWSRDPVFARRCAHFVKASSGWTFLHQAAFFGYEHACRKLIGLGAPVTANARNGQTPIDVAKSQGHDDIVHLLEHAASSAKAPVWKPPADASTLPSSSLWDEAVEKHAKEDMLVSYGGGIVGIRQGDQYFTDSFGRVLVGWHGTYDPPCDMGGYSMIRRPCP